MTVLHSKNLHKTYIPRDIYAHTKIPAWKDPHHLKFLHKNFPHEKSPYALTTVKSVHLEDILSVWLL